MQFKVNFKSSIKFSTGDLYLKCLLFFKCGGGGYMDHLVHGVGMGVVVTIVRYSLNRPETYPCVYIF